MKTRFKILCADNVWRFVFCRSLNGYDAKTKSGVISTECRGRAYVSFSDEQATRDAEYFKQHAHGLEVKREASA